MGSDTNVNLPRLERRKRKSITPAGAIALILFFFICACLGYWLAQIFSDPLIPPDNPDNDTGSQTGLSSPDILNILLLGIDQRENEPARADTIMMAFLNLEQKEVFLLSIPRDTRVAIPGKGVTRKINYAHAVGGADLTVKTVQEFLDVPVHYYLSTNFDGFRNIIKILGGITLNVEQRMYFPEEGIDLEAGLQKLDGDDALSYVRWRGDGRADIGRVERQQKFLKALADQAISFSTIWKIPELLAEINRQVTTDMSIAKMIALANKFRNVSEIKLSTATVPGWPDEENYGASYWIADEKELKELLSEFYY